MKVGMRSVAATTRGVLYESVVGVGVCWVLFGCLACRGGDNAAQLGGRATGHVLAPLARPCW
jgi:hypothetical protein